MTGDNKQNPNPGHVCDCPLDPELHLPWHFLIVESFFFFLRYAICSSLKPMPAVFHCRYNLKLACLSLMPKRYLVHQQQLQQNVVFRQAGNKTRLVRNKVQFEMSSPELSFPSVVLKGDCAATPNPFSSGKTFWHLSAQAPRWLLSFAALSTLRSKLAVLSHYSVNNTVINITAAWKIC